MSRRRLLLIAVPAVLVFLVLSFALARYLTAENRERSAVFGLLQDQARGDAAGMLTRLDDCTGTCRTDVERNARRLRRAGDVKILAYQSSTAYALGAASGPTRVAWTIVNRQLPVVQCVEVQRKGSALAGRTITLRRLSTPINSQGTC